MLSEIFSVKRIEILNMLLQLNSKIKINLLLYHFELDCCKHVAAFSLLINAFLLLLLTLITFFFKIPMASETKKPQSCSGCLIEAIERHDERNLRYLLSATNVEYRDDYWVPREKASVHNS